MTNGEDISASSSCHAHAERILSFDNLFRKDFLRVQFPSPYLLASKHLTKSTSPEHSERRKSSSDTGWATRQQYLKFELSCDCRKSAYNSSRLAYAIAAAHQDLVRLFLRFWHIPASACSRTFLTQVLSFSPVSPVPTSATTLSTSGPVRPKRSTFCQNR